MLHLMWKIALCILFFAQLEIADAGQRHRHRHRHRYFQQQYVNNVDLSKVDQSFANKMLLDFEKDLNTLADGLTINEDVKELANNNVTFPKRPELRAIIFEVPVKSTAHSNLEMKVRDSIERTLNFYGSQLDEITKDDTALSLQILKDIDDKHGASLQKNHPLRKWIEKSCASGKANNGEESFCLSMVRKWKNRSGGINRWTMDNNRWTMDDNRWTMDDNRWTMDNNRWTMDNNRWTMDDNRWAMDNNRWTMDYWKPASVLQSYLNRVDDATLDNIGDEKEGLWGIVNGECQEAIVNRCEIPYICERTLLDPTPRSQYLLTHQIFQRLLIDSSNCPNLKQFVSTDDTYAKLCTKAYLEAQYLDLLDVPINQRDLFAEYVGFCGYLGYTNFLREDWLEKIMKWQSESDSGCFIEDPLTPAGLLTTDMSFQRKATEKELQQGVDQTNEKCLPHLTAVALTAVTAYWDYLMDLNSQEIKHFEL